MEGGCELDGRPAPATPAAADQDGSIVIVLATDAAVCARNLKRLARRCFAGLARTGSSLGNGSGDYALAFSTAPGLRRGPDAPPSLTRSLDNVEMSPLFDAAIEATEEAILNSLTMAEAMTGYDATALCPSGVRALRPAGGTVFP